MYKKRGAKRCETVETRGKLSMWCSTTLCSSQLLPNAGQLFLPSATSVLINLVS